MHEDIKIGIMLLILGGVGIYAFCLLRKSQTRENYVFFSVVLLAFTAIYCVSVLQYTITGNTLGLKKEIQEIKSSNKEISKVSENLVKMMAVIADGGSRWDGLSEYHKQEIEKYKNSIKEYLSPELDEEINETIRRLDLEIEQKNKK